MIRMPNPKNYPGIRNILQVTNAIKPSLMEGFIFVIRGHDLLLFNQLLCFFIVLHYMIKFSFICYLNRCPTLYTVINVPSLFSEIISNSKEAILFFLELPCYIVPSFSITYCTISCFFCIASMTNESIQGLPLLKCATM